MTPGWGVPPPGSTAHYFASDGHSLCGQYVNPHLAMGPGRRKCRTCAASLSRQVAQACGKRCYQSKVDALLVLATVTRRDSTRRARIERRAYYHHACRAWHLTSRGEP